MRIAKEIRRSGVKSLIIVHGGGSFGHPFAKEYEIMSGYKNSHQLIGFSKTHQSMLSLNRLVVDAIIQENVPAIAIQPSAFILTQKGRILNFDNSLILKMLNLNIIPVLYGDVALDSEQGFSILSGDQLVATLAVSFKSNRIIMCVDVDGLFTDDPKINPDAKLIDKISFNELKAFIEKIGRALTVDVTGGMSGKIVELIPALECGVKVELVNAKKANRLYKALLNQKVIETKIES